MISHYTFDPPDASYDPPPASRPSVRRELDRLVDLARRLPERRDRRLVDLLLRQNLSLNAAADLLARPRSRVVRHVTRIVRRMQRPIYRSADRHFRRLDQSQRRLAKLSIFAGLPIRTVASRLGLTLHQTRTRQGQLVQKLRRLERNAAARAD